MRNTQEELEKKVAELEANIKSMEELNAALKVLLKHREDDKNEVGVKVIANVKDLVMPYVEKLKATNLDDTQKTFLEIVDIHLNENYGAFPDEAHLDLYGLHAQGDSGGQSHS